MNKAQIDALTESLRKSVIQACDGLDVANGTPKAGAYATKMFILVELLKAARAVQAVTL